MSQLLFSFSGRLNRKPYWLTTLAMVAVIFVVVILIFALAGGASLLTGDMSGLGVAFILLLIIYIPLIWVGLALGVKRLHDRNKSGWWLVLFWLVPAILNVASEYAGVLGYILMAAGFGISIWGLVEIGFLRGTVGPNQYGPDPLEGHA